ncbi:hypothetical protein B0T16DRAFT_414369 [Cercophora newfieldiana]|uniref:Uncharacterized protein n=1 Tax=Cercophora newfieldiana TaxID=92897 RepID=A0AA39Y6X2_9PEZI|nr:hypothetical protein B0T16DRAFT_414369 [Cercophora newfieldiana]
MNVVFSLEMPLMTVVSSASLTESGLAGPMLAAGFRPRICALMSLMGGLTELHGGNDAESALDMLSAVRTDEVMFQNSGDSSGGKTKLRPKGRAVAIKPQWSALGTSVQTPG